MTTPKDMTPKDARDLAAWYEEQAAVLRKQADEAEKEGKQLQELRLALIDECVAAIKAGARYGSSETWQEGYNAGREDAAFKVACLKEKKS